MLTNLGILIKAMLKIQKYFRIKFIENVFSVPSKGQFLSELMNYILKTWSDYLSY